MQYPYPGDPNSPPVPDQAKVIDDNIIPGKKDDNSGFDIPDDDNGGGTNPGDNIVKKSGCDDPMSLSTYPGATGVKYRVQCGKKCKDEAKVVIGHEIYEWESSVCLAAIHAGLIINEDGGNFQKLI